MSVVVSTSVVSRFDVSGLVFEGFRFPSEVSLSGFREFPQSVSHYFLTQPEISEYLFQDRDLRWVLLSGDCVGVCGWKFKDCVSRVGSARNDSAFSSFVSDYKVSTSWLDCVPGFCEQVDDWLVCECGDEVALLVLDSLGAEVFECVERDTLSAMVGACVEAVNDCDFCLQPVEGVYLAGVIPNKLAGFTVRWAGENCVYQAVIAPVAKKTTEKWRGVKAFRDFRKARVFTEFPAEESDYLFVFFLSRRRTDSDAGLRRCFVSESVLAHLISPYVLRVGDTGE